MNAIVVLQIFSEPVTRRYDGTDATWEILIMLFMAALLGFLLRQVIGYRKKKEIIFDNNSSGGSSKLGVSGNSGVSADMNKLMVENAKLKADLDACRGGNAGGKNNGLSANSAKTTKTTKNTLKSDSGSPTNKTTKATAKSTKTTKTTKATKATKTTKATKNTKATKSTKVTGKTTKATAKSTKTTKATKATKITTGGNKNDLTVVEGIGPAIEKLLNKAGINTYVDLAKAKVADLDKILDDAGPRFRVHVPTTWPEQAGLLRDGKMAEFEKLTEELKGGRRK